VVAHREWRLSCGTTTVRVRSSGRGVTQSIRCALPHRGAPPKPAHDERKAVRDVVDGDPVLGKNRATVSEFVVEETLADRGGVDKT
jgi:hypothetical protein